METITAAVTPFVEHEIIQILLTILVALIIQTIIHRYVGRIVARVVEAHKYSSRKFEIQREETLTGILRTASTVIIWVVSIIMVLSILEVNIAALATGAGLLGIVIGFGAQDAIKDFIGGIFVIAENQYRVGDIVTIAGQSGEVESITVRITRLRDLDGNIHIIPNGHTETVTNMTFDYAHVHMNVGVSYDSDLAKVKKIINEVGEKLAQDKEWQESIIEPVAFLRVDEFDDSAVAIKMIGKVAPGTQWEIAGEFRTRLKKAFEQNGIEIPFPQRVVHMAADKKK